MQNPTIKAEKADLHIHSTSSDGTCSAEEVFILSKNASLDLISITDHDTLHDENMIFKLSQKYNIPAISGVELSTEDRGEVHILGYNVSCGNKNLNIFLQDMRDKRIERTHKILEKLKKQGINITMEMVLAYAGGEAVGRPHIAQCLVQVNACPDIYSAFEMYLGSSGSAYVSREKITPEQAVEVICAAGGKSVLAHPGFIDEKRLPKLLDRLKPAGLWGVEAFYPAHSGKQVSYFEQLAKVRNLFVTAGSDFHGAILDNIVYGEQRTSEYLQYSLSQIVEK